MKCGDCGTAFEPSHFNQRLCGKECKVKARRKVKARYKLSPKGEEPEKRWVKSKRREGNERRYRAKPTARKKAVVRAQRYIDRHDYAREAKRESDRRLAKTPEGRIRDHNRSARRRSREGTGMITLPEWREKLDEFDGRCAYCGSCEQIQKDHIIPLSRGGEHAISNIQPLCRTCNLRKGSKV